MIYNRFLIAVVAEADRAQANAIAQEVAPTPGSVGEDSYSTPLSADGSEPATHAGCFSQASDAMIDQMRARRDRIPSVRFFILDARTPGEETLKSAWLGDMRATVALLRERAGTLFTLDEALAALRLRRVVPPLEMEVGRETD